MRPAAVPEILAAAAPTQLTREIFGNVPGWAQTLFYVLAAAAIAIWVYGVLRRVRLWKQGRRDGSGVNWPLAVGRLMRDVLLQRRVCGRGAASLAHVLLFSGFVVLLIGTTLIAIEHLLADALGRESNNPLFHKGVYFRRLRNRDGRIRHCAHRRLRNVPHSTCARRRQLRAQPGRRRHPRCPDRASASPVISSKACELFSPKRLCLALSPIGYLCRNSVRRRRR